MRVCEVVEDDQWHEADTGAFASSPAEARGKQRRGVLAHRISLPPMVVPAARWRREMLLTGLLRNQDEVHSHRQLRCCAVIAAATPGLSCQERRTRHDLVHNRRDRPARETRWHTQDGMMPLLFTFQLSFQASRQRVIIFHMGVLSWAALLGQPLSVGARNFFHNPLALRLVCILS
jgi:hypothetical protein